jgi:hypothetical protein
MPTVSTSSPKAKAPKARATAARKPATAKATKAASGGARAGARGKAPRAKAARTRATQQTEAALKQAQTATRETAAAVGDYAERAVLIPVGAALIARERVVSGVSDTISTYSSPSKTQQQLRRFERRGATARNRFEREVRKARVRVERELRQRRRAIESTVGNIDERREAIAKNGSELAGRVPDLANRVQERILTLV